MADPFPSVRDQTFPVGAEEGNYAFFGRNVLRGLVEGIDDFIHERQTRWERRTHRIGAPVLLGCSPWVTDDGLLTALKSLGGACVVMTKPVRSDDNVTLSRLREFNKRTPGVEQRALSGLGEMAPRVGGKPLVVGPHTPMGADFTFSTIRSIGLRETGRALPRAHAKLALLGNVCWTDEHPSGAVIDYVWFRPRRLWMSSANFTFGSRQSLEFGYWTEDQALLDGAYTFLTQLIGASEDLESVADAPTPDLAPVEYDDAAMAKAWAEHLAERGDDSDEEDW